MGKLTTYLVLMSGILVFCYFMGIIGPACGTDGLCESTAPPSLLLTLIMAPQNLATSTLALTITTAITGLAALASIVIGFANLNIKLALTGGVATFLLALGWDILAVFNALRLSRPEIAILIFAPLLIMWIITVFEWWGDRD